MKPFLSFIGGCEFVHLIQTLAKQRKDYFDFDFFYSYEGAKETDAHLFVTENQQMLIRQKPDMIILSQANKIVPSIIQIQFNKPNSKAQQDQNLDELAWRCEDMIQKLTPVGAPIIMQYFPQARLNMLNRFKPDTEIYNESQFLRKYVTAMEELSQKYPNFYFMDLSDVCARYGCNNTLKRCNAPWFEHLTEDAGYIAEEFRHWINYVLRQPKKVKCVLVDLDNTMWNGVIRDIGVENLEIRNDKELFRWHVLRILYSRGILCGIVSKNDPHLRDMIQKFIDDYCDGTKFVCLELSWDDKSDVIQQVAGRLNIGMDSIAFIDDSPFERQQVAAMLPDVRVYDENIFEQLLQMPEFQPEYVTKESKKRTDFYVQEDKRKQASRNLSKEDFLKQCDYKIKVKRMEPFETNRVTELIGRTNQLNTSIKRYSKDEVIAMSNDSSFDIFTVHVSDKFGDYGLVGACIARRLDGRLCEIDTLLFSCRVMSRGVEDFVLSTVLANIKDDGFSEVVIRFQRGEKNAGMQTILTNNGFTETGTLNHLISYSFDLTSREINPLPSWFSDMAVPESTAPQPVITMS